MSRMIWTFSDVYTKVAEFLGLGSSPTGTELTKVKDLTYRGYMKFLYPMHPISKRRHVWSFLKERMVISVYSGTWRYPLPVNFERMLGNPQYGDQDGYPELTKVSWDSILNKRNYGNVSSYPVEYAVKVLSTDNEIGTKWEMGLWPEPNGNYNINCQYEIAPEKPTDDSEYFLGGNYNSEVILQCALAMAEHQEDDMETVHHTELANDMLAKAILADTVDTPKTVGRMTLFPGIQFLRGFVKTDDSEIYADDR